MRRSRWLRNVLAKLTPARRVRFVEGDSLPLRLPILDVIVAREEGEDWCVGLRCPCGCCKRLEMMLLKGVEPRWDISLDQKGRPTLRPSVWLGVGCRSHFWLRNGKVVWCE